MDRMKIKHTNQLEREHRTKFQPYKISCYTVIAMTLQLTSMSCNYISYLYYISG